MIVLRKSTKNKRHDSSSSLFFLITPSFPIIHFYHFPNLSIPLPIYVFFFFFYQRLMLFIVSCKINYMCLLRIIILGISLFCYISNAFPF